MASSMPLTATAGFTRTRAISRNKITFKVPQPQIIGSTSEVVDSALGSPYKTSDNIFSNKLTKKPIKVKKRLAGSIPLRSPSKHNASQLS